MSKEKICVSLYDSLVSRFSAERPGMVISGLFAERLFLSIMDIFNREGEEAARRYVREARLL